MSVDVQPCDTCPPGIAAFVTEQLEKLAAAAGVESGTLSVAVVDDATMSDLHQRYRHEAGTTDVLTFDLRDDPSTQPLEGEVVVCWDEALRQSAAHGHEPRLELLLYCLHGLLHLLGEDDVTPDGYDRMHDREDELLRAVGLPAAFHTAAKGGGA